MGLAENAWNRPAVEIGAEPSTPTAGVVRLFGRVVALFAESVVSHEATDHSVEMD